jgi:hypothetical protein
MSRNRKLQTWEIPPNKINNWRRLNPDVPKETATDCTINSLHFLGVIENPDFARIMSDYANANQRGITEAEILKFIYDKFNEDNDYEIKNYKMDTKLDREIRNELTNNTYTIASYFRSSTGMQGQGHTVILTKQNNIIYVFDPQQETIYCELTNYNDWVNSQNFDRDENGALHIAYILKDKVARKREETTVTIRNRNSRSPSPPTKKRKTNRVNGGNRRRTRHRRRRRI